MSDWKCVVSSSLLERIQNKAKVGRQCECDAARCGLQYGVIPCGVIGRPAPGNSQYRVVFEDLREGRTS